MKLKMICLLLILVQLLIIWLITNWLVLVGVIIATSALTWFATATPALLDDPPGEVVLDGVEYEIR